MEVRLQPILRWFLALVALCASTFAALILSMGLMLWPDRAVVSGISALGIAPRAAIEALHRLDLFVALLIWVVPSTCAMAFAARTLQRRALRLGSCISILLFAILCFFLGRGDRSGSTEFVAVIAAVLVLCALALSFTKSKFSRLHPAVNLTAVVLLFSPSVVALARRTGAAPQPRQLWSTKLQREQWQSMNTGSEYAAIRQVAFAGDRVIAVFDAGFAPSQPPKKKWPLSIYKLISLDVKTGAKRNEITFPGRWGAMPYIYGTQSGLIDVQSDPPRNLNPDLTPATNSSDPASADRMATPKHSECGPICDPPTYALTKNTFVQLRPKHFQIVDSTGHVLSHGNLVEWGSFAGASADGRRFAIESSYSEGDPDFVVYEYFTIYDAASGNALATIHVRDLPDRQSWSAVSPDGRYFVAGNPNRLTMYERS